MIRPEHPAISASLTAGLGADVLLEHGELGLDAPGFANIGGLGQAVVGSDQVGPEPESLPAGLAVRSGTIGLKPVEEREAELLRPGDVPLGVGRRDLGADQRAEPVVVLRPVHERRARAAGIVAGLEIPRVEDSPVNPQPVARASRVEAAAGRLERDRIGVVQIEQPSRPRGVDGRDVGFPEVVLGGPVDGVVLPVEVVDREAAGDPLLVVGLSVAGRAARRFDPVPRRRSRTRRPPAAAGRPARWRQGNKARPAPARGRSCGRAP